VLRLFRRRLLQLPTLLRPLSGNPGCEDTGPALNLRVPVFNRGERSPIAQLKRMPGVLEISSGKIVHSQAIASGEYQVIEASSLVKKGLNSPFVRDVNRLPLCVPTYGLGGFLKSFRVA